MSRKDDRSDLFRDESVRLDLCYVKNWSVVSDLMIPWRTGLSPA